LPTIIPEGVNLFEAIPTQFPLKNVHHYKQVLQNGTTK